MCSFAYTELDGGVVLSRYHSTTINVMKLKKKPRIPNRARLRPLPPAMAAQAKAKTRLIRTEMM